MYLYDHRCVHASPQNLCGSLHGQRRGVSAEKPVEKEIINDYNGDLVRFFRVLQRNENLERLIGRLFLSFNSEQIFRANKALLAEVPNILDDLTETSVIIHPY